MIIDPMYGQILYNCYLSNGFKLKPGHNPKIIFVKMKRATGKQIAEHVIRPVNVIPASSVTARCAKLLIIVHRLWTTPKRVDERMERRERRLVCK